MDNPGDLMHLCRLCLVKDQVNIPIFEEHGDIRQIFVKISSCLPVKVSKDDQLPKRICDGCSNKLDLLYEFCNTSANSEKKLLSWLEQAGLKDVDTISAVAQHTAKPLETQTQVKQEALEDIHAAVQQTDHLELTDEGVGAAVFEENAIDESDEPPPPKRARRTAAVKAQINITPDSDDDDDMDISEPMTKVEDESDDSDVDKDPSYVDVPGTSADDQPGPSGVGKDGVEAPFIKTIDANTKITGISWQCSSCSERFRNLTSLKTHMESNCDGLKMQDDTTTIVITDNDDEDYNYPKAVKKRGRPRQSKPAPSRRSMKPATHTIIIKNDNGNEIIMTEVTDSPEDVYWKPVKQPSKLAKTSDKETEKCFWPCSQCPQMFSTEKLLEDHLIKCILGNEPTMKPKKPRKQGNSAGALESPYQFDRFRNVYICGKCFAKFQYKSDVEQHIKEHFLFACKVCDTNFESFFDLGCHSATHGDYKTMTCPCCRFQTVKKAELRHHIQTEHNNMTEGSEPEEKKFECVVCKKAFSCHTSMWNHQRYSHKVTVDSESQMGAKLEPSNKVSEVFLCDTCGKGFSSKYRLERHIKAMHQGFRPFVCRYCGRAFTGKDTMKKHERIHTGEKPYSCEYCGKCFRQPGPFSVHLRIHTGEKPYECKFCKKCFITNQSRKSHMNNCTGREMNYLNLSDC